jgi:hypothetical protein
VTNDGRVLTLVVDTPGSVTSQPAPAPATPGDDFLEGKAPRPSAKRVRKLFQYDRETGELRWRVNRGSARAGDVAGYLRPDGYWGIGIDGTDLLAHCIIWCGVTGEWPTNEVDHADTCRSNNAWSNLREATRTEQNTNQKLRSDNTSGAKGVVRLPSGLYSASIKSEGKKIALGTFATLDEAADAWWAASQELHGEFARQDRRLSSEDHFDRIEQSRGRPTMQELRDRAKMWREIRDIGWVDCLDRREMAIEAEIDAWRASQNAKERANDFLGR